MRQPNKRILTYVRYYFIFIFLAVINLVSAQDLSVLPEIKTGSSKNEIITPVFSSDSIGFFKLKDSSEEKKSKKRWKGAALISTGLITTGLVMAVVPESVPFCKYTVRDEILETYPGFSTKLDNYTQFLPGVAVFGLKAAGVKSRSDLLNQGIILVKSQLLQSTIVRTLKEITNIERPNGNGNHSMPSGHTAEAFQLATMLDMEYRDVSLWISAAGYATATATGVMRMLNNKHWDSDVLVGAGIGFISTKIVYLTHKYRWKKNSNIVVLPAIYKNGGGIVFAMQL